MIRSAAWSFSIVIIMLGSFTHLYSEVVKKGDEYYLTDPVIVVAERAQQRLLEAMVSVTTMERDEISRLPARNLADVLSFVPGISFTETGPSPDSPAAVVRGFYGGGETAYVLLLIDGIPVNDPRSGTVDWGAISPASIERIEILRGAGSAVYGDASMGAVINVITNQADGAGSSSVSVRVGENDLYATDAFLNLGRPTSQVSVLAHGEKEHGFRAHSRWSNVFTEGSYIRALGNKRRGFATFKLRESNSEQPGPLTESQIEADREQGDALFEDDIRDKRSLEISCGYQSNSSLHTGLSIMLGLCLVNQEETSTILLGPQMVDSQFGDESSYRISATCVKSDSLYGFPVVAGVDWSFSHYRNQYSAALDHNDRLSGGKGRRSQIGTFVEINRQLLHGLRLHSGVRFDLLRDQFIGDSLKFAPEFTRWSPRIGLNLTYSGDKRYPGSAFLNWTRAFKAPTLEQLYDSRIIQGIPGMLLNFSSAELQPQVSETVEFGVRQCFLLVPKLLLGDLSLAVFRTNVDEEIDFDLASLKYGNIHQSRHDGAEIGLTLYMSSLATLRSSATVSETEFRSGDYAGNQLKHIPRHTAYNSLEIQSSKRLGFTITHRYFGEVYINDESTQRIPGRNIFDFKAQMWLKMNVIEAHVLVQNLADQHFNSTGYSLFDPASMSELTYLYPGAGRQVSGNLIFHL